MHVPVEGTPDKWLSEFLVYSFKGEYVVVFLALAATMEPWRLIFKFAKNCNLRPQWSSFLDLCTWIILLFVVSPKSPVLTPTPMYIDSEYPMCPWWLSKYVPIRLVPHIMLS